MLNVLAAASAALYAEAPARLVVEPLELGVGRETLHVDAVNDKRPNIVLLLADDLGWNEIGYHNPSVHTPRMGALADDGVKLQRMYSHFICGPSRASLQTGRSPIHTSLENGSPWSYAPSDGEYGFEGAPPQYEGLGSVMRRAGYRTHVLGKWHAGMAHAAQTPAGRGYDTALVHFTSQVGGWTHNTKDAMMDMPGAFEPLVGDRRYYADEATVSFSDASSSCHGGVVDWWESGEGIMPTHGRPAVGALNVNGCTEKTALNNWTDSDQCVHMDDYIVGRAEKIIATHAEEDNATPMFLLVSTHAKHSLHDETAVLKACGKGVPNSDIRDCKIRAAITHLDALAGRLEDALRLHGMWDSSLFVFSSDNGGPQAPPMTSTEMRSDLLTRPRSIPFGWDEDWDSEEFNLHGVVAPAPQWVNTPLRGYKHTVWEGGLRVPAFVSGGYVPQMHRGQSTSALIALHDLYASFAALGGVTNLQGRPSERLFAVDSIDQSEVLLGRTNETLRTEVVVGNTPCGEEKFAKCDGHGAVINALIAHTNGALFKIVVGSQLKESGHKDEPVKHRTQCGRTPHDGCLYEISADPAETDNLASAKPKVFEYLLKRVDVHSQHVALQPAPALWRTQNLLECEVGPYAGFDEAWDEAGSGSSESGSGSGFRRARAELLA